jgi:3alpha(or 20beta)-hydroxysteroid dehydrogenase
MTKLAGKVAIVTGAARGLGAATAGRLCQEGAAVMLADVLTEGHATATALRDAGYRAAFRMMDVRDECAWLSLVETTIDTFGGLDILVNNAGIFMPADIESITIEQLKIVYDVNVVGPLLGMKTAIPALRSKGAGRSSTSHRTQRSSTSPLVAATGRVRPRSRASPRRRLSTARRRATTFASIRSIRVPMKPR